LNLLDGCGKGHLRQQALHGVHGGPKEIVVGLAQGGGHLVGLTLSLLQNHSAMLPYGLLIGKHGT